MSTRSQIVDEEESRLAMKQVAGDTLAKLLQEIRAGIVEVESLTTGPGELKLTYRKL